jgi:hypothetical protein
MGAPFSLRPDQISHILKLYKRLAHKGYTLGEACRQIAPLYDRHVDTIINLVRRLTSDTTEVAGHYMKSNALRLAMRVVRDANVQQSMDILERPNMGVLAPKKAAGEGSRGFFLTVSADSCGAVKASVGMIEGGPNAIQEPEAGASGLRGLLGTGDEGEGEDLGLGDGPSLPAEARQEVQGGEGVPGFSVLDDNPEVKRDSLGRPYTRGKERGFGKSKRYQVALERAKQRIEAAKV